MLEWLRDRCVEVYGEAKVADDFFISEHAVGITLRGTGLKIDVAPVLYEGESAHRGYLIIRQGDRVLTSVTLRAELPVQDHEEDIRRRPKRWQGRYSPRSD